MRRRPPQLTYEQLSIAHDRLISEAKELLSTYKSEQLKIDNARYLPLFRPRTTNDNHEHWAQFLMRVACSLDQFILRDQEMTSLRKNILSDSFRFVLKELANSNEATSALAVCCSESLAKDGKCFADIFNKEYEALLGHLKRFSSMKDSGSLHPTISNEELFELVQACNGEVVEQQKKEKQEQRFIKSSEEEGFVYVTCKKTIN